MKTILPALLASGAGLLAVFQPVPSAADESPAIIEHAKVHYGDLDLATPDGAGAMLARLETAASNACGGRPSLSIVNPLVSAKQRAYRRCRIAALDAATLRLGAPLVRSAWLERDETARHLADARRATADLLRGGGAGGLP